MDNIQKIDHSTNILVYTGHLALLGWHLEGYNNHLEDLETIGMMLVK
jgi:hypothetical protein